MNINTNTGNLTLTKTEQKLLVKTKTLLTKIAKHGDGMLAQSADVSADAIDDVLKDLNKVEEEVAA